MPSDVLVPPAHQWTPPRVGSYGPEVVGWADSCGMTLDPEQALAIDQTYSYGPDGRLVATETGLVVARQNIKSHVLRACALADLFVFAEPGCMWTAHRRRTILGAFADCKATIDNHDHLRRYVRKISEADGEESIELLSGASLEFQTRSAQNARGLTGRRLTLDEALYLEAATLGALVPVLSAQTVKADVQLRYASSAGMAKSAVLRGVRDRGRAGGQARLAYLEWTAERRPCDDERCDHEQGTPGCWFDDVEALQQANPALHRRISLEFVLSTERAAMSPEEFGRERMGQWDEPLDDGSSGAFDAGSFMVLADPLARRDGAPVRFAVAAAPDRSWCAVACAWRRPDGLAQVLLLDYHRGTSWVPARLAHLLAEHGGTVVAVNTPARGLLAEGLADELSQQEQARAHTGLATACEGATSSPPTATVRHGGEPALLTSVRGARWRPVGDSRVLDRKGTTDIAPLDACALALDALTTQPAVDVEGTIW